MRKLLPTSVPKPKPKSKPSPKYSSIRERTHAEKLEAAQRLRSKKPIKKKRRKPSEDLRIYGPRDFRDWLHRQACLGCGARENIQQAHRFTGGMGRKCDWQDTIPLCGPRLVQANQHCHREDYTTRGCHESYDRAKQSWSATHNLPARAAHFWEQWLLYQGLRDEVRSRVQRGNE